MKTVDRFGSIAVAVVGSLIAGWAAARSPQFLYASLAVAIVTLTPAGLLLAGGVAASGGVLQAPIFGPLIAADLLLLAWLARSVIASTGARLPEATRGPVFALFLFLGWALLATYIDGQSITPLLRIGLYAVIFAQLARARTNPRFLYAAVTAFALWNIVGGAMEGQTRLVGLYVGDPAQMGALILAALIPLATKEFRFPGWQLAALLLTYGLWLTQTRSVWFATVVVAAVWFTGRREIGRVRTIVLLGLVTVVGLKAVGVVTASLGLNADSAAYRLDSIMNGIRAGLAHPVFGTGWATARSVDLSGQAYQNASSVIPYNLFVNVFTTTGFPGLVLLGVFLWTLLGCLVHRRDTPLLYAVAVLAMSLTEMTIYAGSMLTVLFFVYVGIGLNLSARRQTPPAVPGPEIEGSRSRPATLRSPVAGRP